MLKPESIAKNLVVLPSQPMDQPWPTEHWQTADPETSDQGR